MASFFFSFFFTAEENFRNSFFCRIKQNMDFFCYRKKNKSMGLSFALSKKEQNHAFLICGTLLLFLMLIGQMN